MRPTINLLILNVMPLFYKNNYNLSPNLNICTILSAQKNLECVYFYRISTLFRERYVQFFLECIRKKRHDGEAIVIIGLQQLRTSFGSYEQFVGHLWNVFKISNGRRSLWNGTQGAFP